MVAQEDLDLTIGIRANGNLKSWSARKDLITRGVLLLILHDSDALLLILHDSDALPSL